MQRVDLLALLREFKAPRKAIDAAMEAIASAPDADISKTTPDAAKRWLFAIIDQSISYDGYATEEGKS